MYAPAALVAPGGFITGLSGGRAVSTTPGTPVKISSTSQSCTGAVVQALLTNTGNIAVGGNDVNVHGGAGAENGIELIAGQTITLFTSLTLASFISTLR